MKKATCKFSRNRGTWIVEFPTGHFVFADLKRARAFCEGYNKGNEDGVESVRQLVVDDDEIYTTEEVRTARNRMKASIIEKIKF